MKIQTVVIPEFFQENREKYVWEDALRPKMASCMFLMLFRHFGDSQHFMRAFKLAQNLRMTTAFVALWAMNNR